VRALRSTGEAFDPAEHADHFEDDDAVYRPRPGDPRVTLRLAPEAGWVVEHHPHEQAEQRRDGGWDIVLAVSEPAWLERLLLELGPAATVTTPPSARALASDAAARILTRYRS